MESEPRAGISQDGGSAAPGADVVLGRGVGVWCLELRAGERSACEGISASDILPFGSRCGEAGAGIGL